jgi:hypothetical protein
MNLKIAKPQTEAQKSTRTTLDTIEVTPDVIKSWKLPPFQRPLRVNDKLIALSQMIKSDGGVIPGVITIGVLDKERYIVDGQHRREAFLMSECLTGYVDVRVLHFNDMGEMGDEFVSLNSQIVKMRPDDILRGLEGSYPSLLRIRKRCSFVGYDQIRRSERAPVLSMSSALRSWKGSATEVPKGGGEAAGTVARNLTVEDADELIGFLDCCFTAWGKDAANTRLWSALNLTLVMWMYRRMVITQWSPRSPKLTRDLFTKCLMTVSASETYVDWLVGRNLSQRDIAPAYTRLKAAFATRLEKELGKKPSLPQPPWATR